MSKRILGKKVPKKIRQDIKVWLKSKDYDLTEITDSKELELFGRDVLGAQLVEEYDA